MPMKSTRCIPVALFLAMAATAGCDGAPPPPHLRVAGGDPERGATAIMAYGCGGCHTIPGIRGADGTVGPPLTDYAMRGYVAGVLPNWPRHLVRWIVNPPAISPQTAMPALGVTEQDARDVAAYLYTLGANKAAVYPPLPIPPLAPREELEALRAEEDRLLAGYERIGPNRVRIPIERAMELLIDLGAANRP
jgi:mono/diheme cytochrome c family protein